jgi:CubicO group peptidase (beta-lactamase class C family)
MQQKLRVCSKTVIILAVTCLFLQQPVFARKSKVALIDDFARAKHKYHNFNGNVLVEQAGRIIYQNSFGYADLKNRKPLDGESVFNIASISKQFTAAAVMLCVERGLMSLDDSLSKYFPDIPYQGITVRQMLTHTSGLPEQNELMYKYWNSERFVTNNDMVEYLIKYKPPAAFMPGESFKYCNTNYSLLALIVEKVSGTRFQDFVAKNIFEPLGMRRTQFLKIEDGHPGAIPNQTENYIFDAEREAFFPPEEIPQWKKAVPLTGLVGAGNIYSTVSDLLVWQESLKSAKILKPESIAEMEKPQVRANVDGSDAYGFGLAIKSIYNDTKIFHYGGTLGYWNSLQHFKNADLTIIVLSNNESEKGLTNAIAAIFFDQQVVLPSAHKEIRLKPEELNRFAGTYQAANGSSFSIENRSGKLYRIVAGGEPKELKPESKTKLFYADGTDRQIEFVFEKGNVKQVSFIADGLKIELKKVR